MTYCINPNCHERQNPDSAENCQFCGTPLLINDRIRLIKPIRLLSENPFEYFTEIFEVDDAGTQWHIKDDWHRERIMKVLTWNRPELLSLFEREAQALRRIKHPGIPRATIDDYFTFTPTTCPKLYCLVMQKIDGENLDQWIEQNGKISSSLALRWLQQLFEILDFIHQAGYFHRDIKPSNIVVQPNGQLALIDFGGVREVTNTYLAKISSGGISGTGRGYEITAIHTPRFSPLEQINGQAVPQSDFYAVARTFVYCITGIQLFDLPTDQSNGRLIWRSEAPHIDQPLADFLDDLMSPFPAQRPQSTQIILQRLARLPLKSKLNRIVKSKPFTISVIILGLLTAFGVYNLSLPMIATYFLTQGKKAQLQNRATEAQKDFQMAIKLWGDTSDSISKFYFDQASRNQERPQQAKEYYKLAIKFNPLDSEAYNNLAVVCQQLHDFSCVNRSYEYLFKLQPNSWEGHYGLGVFYDDLQEYSLAQKQYEKALQANPKAIPAINNLSRLNNINGDYKNAIFLAKTGLQLAKEPDDKADSYKNLGWAEFSLKEYTLAKASLLKAVDLDPQRTDAYCLLAQTQEALGEKSDAQLQWEVCLIAKSGLPEVQGWRQNILNRIFRTNAGYSVQK